MKRILTFILIYALIVSQAFAIPFIDRHEAYKYGNGTTSTKTFEYDFGLGVLNPKMQVDNSQGFVFDKALSSQGLTSPSLSVTGTGTATFSGKGLFLDDLTGKNLKASGNALTIGDGAASNKSITFDKGAGASNPFMKWDETQSALVYSNDGTLVKKIGSGSGGGDGGGVNFLKNGGFEDLKANWTESGGTFTAEAFATGIESDLKFGQWVATSASQTLCSDLVNTPSFANAGGMFDLAYTASGSQFLVYVKDGSGNKLTADQSLLDQTAWAKLSPIPFSFNTSQRLCFESKGAATLKLNNAYMGTNKNVNSVVYVKQGEVYAQGNAAQSITVNVTDIPFILSSDNEALVGRWNGTSFIAPFDADYDIKGAVYFGSILSRQVVAYVNGVSVKQLSASDYSGNAPQFVGRLRLLKDQVLTFRIAANGGTLVNGPANHWLSISVSKAISDQVQTPEASQWFIDANIGGANPSLGLVSISSFTEITNSGLDLVVNTSKGSASAEIGCASGYPSSGLTCPSSNESVAIAFIPPYSGIFEVCADYTYFSGSTNHMLATFQLVETPNSSSTILQEGGIRTEGGGSVTNLQNLLNPFKTCGTFKFSDTSKRTIRLMYEQSQASGVASSLFMDRDINSGQRDLHITVRPLLQNSLRAILTGDQVTSPNVKNPEIFSVVYYGASAGVNCSSNPCGISQSSGKVSYIGYNSTGSYTINFNKTYSFISCSYTGQATGILGAFVNDPLYCSNCSSLGMTTVYGTTVSNTRGVINCFGY